MIVDSSALIAIVRNEPEAVRFADLLVEAEAVRMSAATYLEAAIKVDSSGDPLMIREFDRLLSAARIGIEAVTVEQAEVARAAYRDFGKGSGHPARLNFGDCFAYALASTTLEPLLYKGDDFGHTDIPSAAGDENKHG